ncbi:DUF4158 domain-containing protein, partial [Escherichia coli]|uniref:DUF4158 domain-containing protein n=1 Tax=Escherichia coli TaxID=562 RepID=UPI0039657723
MSRRHIFTERQRAALFDLPTDELSLLKFYTLGDDDLENIRQRRRPENRIGFALQLCALRYPGRALAPGEMIPREVLSFVGAQLGVPADALLTYATRRQTGTVAKLAMRQPFVLFKGLTFQKLCLPGAFRPGDHHNKMLRPG